MRQTLIKVFRWTIGLLLFIGFLFWLLPVPQSERTYSTALFDEEGNLLSAAMTDDEQWCFPSTSTLPTNYISALIAYEDERFYYHPGVDLYAIARAFWTNVTQGSIRQGASTISMQVSRLIKPRSKRSFWNKAVELVLALRLELAYSKAELLMAYAHHAPFGSNIIGIEAATNRYFGTSPASISWAQAALLAVLPNNPALIFPGKNKERLMAKRNRLLHKLARETTIDSTTLELALLEPIPESILPIPSSCAHLLTRALNDGKKGQQLTVTLDPILQKRAALILKRHGYYLKGNQIMNGAAIILDGSTGRCLAYLGNFPGNSQLNGTSIDMIQAKRSYGSVLKPFLYEAMLEEGQLLPNAFVDDIPTNYDGYSPNNYFLEFDGVVNANEVLSRSLNVPSVRMLHQFGVQKFIDRLTKMNIRSINKPASHYGLSLILGGGEATLWELSGAYLSLFRAAKLHPTSVSPFYTQQDSISFSHPFSALAAYYTLDAITDRRRTGADGEWMEFANEQTIAWKTGTSFGARDAWSIGLSGNYIVGVWVGNADGEGRPSLTGIGMASPIMFDLFNLLPKQAWLDEPFCAKSIKVCQQSGWKATPDCPTSHELKDPSVIGFSPSCSFHKRIALDSSGSHRVTSACYPSFSMKHEVMFVLPPIQEWYYKKKHADFKKLPPFYNNCLSSGYEKNIGLLYPRKGIRVFIPKELSGKKSKVVFEATHRLEQQRIFWHLNNEFVGETTTIHQLELSPKAGDYLLTLVDEKGEQLQCSFTVVEK